jgi:hypothetical protein
MERNPVSEYVGAMAAQGYGHQKAPPSEYEKAALEWARAKDRALHAAGEARRLAAEAQTAAAKEEEMWNRLCSLRLPQPEGIPPLTRPAY